MRQCSDRLPSQNICLTEDSTGKIFLVCVKRPDDPSYMEDVEKATVAMLECGRTTALGKADVNHSRGVYPVLRCGITKGPGSKEPHNLDLKDNEEQVKRLLSHPSIRRMGMFADGKTLSNPLRSMGY
jgi:hypothetical protein